MTENRSVHEIRTQFGRAALFIDKILENFFYNTTTYKLTVIKRIHKLCSASEKDNLPSKNISELLLIGKTRNPDFTIFDTSAFRGQPFC